MREKETVLDEKIIETKEEVVVDPMTGEETVQTFEYVEKTIETEVCYKMKMNENRTQFSPFFGSFHRTIFLCLFCIIFSSHV